MAIPTQPNQFHPVTAYDVPGVLFQQLLDDELTWTGIKKTLTQPHLLSPAERNSFADSLKEKIGARDPFSQSLIDVATNPWVWFSFLTTPGVPTALKAGGKTIFEGSKFGAFVRENTPALMSMGFWNSNAHFRQSAIGTALLKAANIRNDFIAQAKARTGVLEQKIISDLRAQGIKVRSLDPTRVPEKYREIIQEIDTARYAAANGLNQSGSHYVTKADDVYEAKWVTVDPDTGGTLPIKIEDLPDDIRKRFSTWDGEKRLDPVSARNMEEAATTLRAESAALTKKGEASIQLNFNLKEGGVRAGIQESKEVVPQLVDNDVMQGVINKYGLSGLIQADRRNLDEMFIKLYGHEPTLARFDNNASVLMQAFRDGDVVMGDLIDENKIKRIWKSASNDAIVEDFKDPFTNESLKMTAGKRLVSEFFSYSPRQVESLNQTQFTSRIMDIFDIHLKNERYFPFGLREHVNADMKPVFGRNRAEADGVRAAVASGMSLPRAVHPNQHAYHLDDLAAFKRMAGDNARVISNIEGLEQVTRGSLESVRGTGKSLSIRRANASRSLDLYTQRAAETYSLHVAGATTRYVGEGKSVIEYDMDGIWKEVDDMQVIQQRELNSTAAGTERSNVPLYGEEPANISFGRATVGDRFLQAAREGRAPDGGFSLADVLNQGFKGMDETQTMSKELLKESLIPRFMGRRTMQEMSNYNMSAFTKWATGMLAESPIGAMMEASGEWGKGIRQNLRKLAEDPSALSSPRQVSGVIAKGLYVTHLGANMASVVLNMTQPWMHGATWLGIDNVLAGYKEAFKELGAYANARMKTGKILLPDDQRMELINSSFKHSQDDLLGIGPDLYALQDAVEFAGKGGIKSPTQQAIFDAPMKLFEKAEWLNRLVMAHGMENAWKQAGRSLDDKAGLSMAIRASVEETQFGGNLLNTPTIFLGKGILGGMGDSPLVRQFLTFPTRSIMSFLQTSKEIGGGVRKIGGITIDPNDWKYLGGIAPTMIDFARGLGIASMLYYTGKNFFDADLSRGLVANASTDLFGGSEFLEGGDYDWFPVPPAADIMFQGARSLIAGDIELFRRQAPRLIPGGVGLARLFAVSPPGIGMGKDNYLGDLASKMQRSYADYANPTPDGLVPFYKGDGTFVDFRKPVDLILQGVGLDLGKSQVKGELDGYLVKQREQILEYRNRFLTAMFANNISKAMGIKKEFERRFKIPLTITKENLRSRMRNRNITRTERIADRLPPEARSTYGGFMAARGAEMGIDPSAFNPETPTSTSRSKEFARPQNNNLDPETVKALKEMVNQSKKDKPIKQRSFTESYVANDWYQ